MNRMHKCLFTLFVYVVCLHCLFMLFVYIVCLYCIFCICPMFYITHKCHRIDHSCSKTRYITGSSYSK